MRDYFRFFKQSLLILFFFLTSSVVYASREDRIDVIIPGFLFKLEKNLKENSDASDNTVELLLKGAVASSNELFGPKCVDNQPSLVAAFQLAKEPPENQFSLLVHKGIHGLSMVYQWGKSSTHRVILITHSDLGGVSNPLSERRRRSIVSKVKEGAFKPFDYLHFAYKIEYSKSTSSSGEKVLEITDMLGANLQDLPHIKQHWLSSLVLYYVQQFDLMKRLTPFAENSNQNYAIVVTGRIERSRGCSLQFRAEPRDPQTLPSRLQIAKISPSYDSEYEVMTPSEPKFLVLESSEQDPEKLHEKILKWLPATEQLITDEINGSLSLGTKPHRESPFFVEGWHYDGEFRGQGPYIVPFNAIADEWIVRSEDCYMDMTMAKSLERNVALNSPLSTAVAPSRVHRSTHFSKRYSFSSLSAADGHRSLNLGVGHPSGSPGGFLEIAERLSLEGDRGSFRTPNTNSMEQIEDHGQFPSLSLAGGAQGFTPENHASDLRLLALQSAVKHAVFHSQDPIVGNWATEDDIRSIYGTMRKTVGQYAEELKRYKEGRGEKVKKKSPIVKLESIAQEIESDLKTKTGQFALHTALHLNRTEIQRLNLVGPSNHCPHCTGEAGSNLFAYLRLGMSKGQ